MQFLELYVSERDRMERQVGRRIGCPSLAGDIVQDIFLRLWERATNWQGEPAAYLSRCARNASIDHLRAEHARARLMAEAALRSEALLVPSGEDVLAAREELDLIDAALLGLPAKTRHIFLLNRVHGRKLTEIAPVFGISERAVAKHMARAIEACAKARG
ncbi:RNA polymerase sigma factor [Gemmobacter serpentinus]|uniref:RNA polymerase sigma factor n=1 Tax=Gemmobacter serpentinus TaxID=2652247 RepID=UPI00124E94C2|nr:RNA polymerase sigma factor [Gemmobacter serpentinus]